MFEALSVAIGAFFGALLRVWFLEEGFTLKIDLPLIIFSVNCLGSFFMGFIKAKQKSCSKNYSLLFTLLTTGFLGSFTTFSSFISDGAQMISVNQFALSMLYVAATLLFGIAAAALGFYLGKAKTEKPHP